MALAFAGAAHAYLRHAHVAQVVLHVVIEESWLVCLSKGYIYVAAVEAEHCLTSPQIERTDIAHGV